LSQGDVAQMMHSSRQHISSYERNERTPTLSQAAKLAKIYGVTLEAIYEAVKEQKQGD
jgi:transcriptional regulator with XRE-family HTH domain